MIDNTKEYVKYAQDVLDGTEPAGKYIKLAAKRFIDWFSRDDIYFDYDDVDKKIRFVGRIKHWEPPFNDQPFILLPWQQFVFANIFGWKYVATDFRVTKKALLMISRKNGKTALAAAIMLAALTCDNITGASGYTIANTGAQAGIAFRHISRFAGSLDRKNKLYKRFRSSLRIPILLNEINVLNSDTEHLDGLNPYIYIVDEYHAAKSPEVFNILQNGSVAQNNALGIIISTAGFLVGDEYPLYAQWKTAKQILEGAIEDESWFNLLYQLDEGDDWKDESVWKKASPSLGVTIRMKEMREQISDAILNPLLENSIKTKNLNMFVSSSNTWIPVEEINKVTEKFNLTDFDPEDNYCFVGMDLSDISDFSVLTTMIYNKNVKKFYFKAFPFICRKGLEKSPNKELFRRWIDKGYLTFVDMPVIDHDWIVKKVEEINDELPIAYIGYDKWHAKQIALKCYKQGIPLHKISQSIANFGQPTKDLYSLILNERCVLDDSPVIRWCFSNVNMKYDENGNCKPGKISKASAQLIDVVIGFIMTVSLWTDIFGPIEDTLKDDEIMNKVTVLS